MDFWPFVGYIAASISTVELIPEVLKALRTKHLNDISWVMLIMMFCSSTLWASYGIYLQNIPLIISGTVNAAMEITLIILKRRFAKKSRHHSAKRGNLEPATQTQPVRVD